MGVPVDAGYKELWRRIVEEHELRKDIQFGVHISSIKRACPFSSLLFCLRLLCFSAVSPLLLHWVWLGCLLLQR